MLKRKLVNCMTDRAEIEHLLNQTGRTLEGLSETYPLDVRVRRILDIAKYAELSPGAYKLIDRILHQSDVIELLVGALRDAMDKPMQKPLTERELHALIDAGDDIAVYCESKNDDYAYAMLFFGGNNIDRDGVMIGNDELIWFQYGIRWRAWASKPTDEERRAAAWES